MTRAGVLLALTLVVPFVMLLACSSRHWRDRVPALLALAPVPALAAALFAAGSEFVLPGMLPGVMLALDVPGAMLLGVVALLWITAGFYASAWLRGSSGAGRFSVWWLLTLTGSVGVFMAADLVSFYLVFSMVSLAAYGLVVHDSTPRARWAGGVYVSLAVLGEAFLLLGFVFLGQATPSGSLLIRDAVAALPTSPWHDATLALLILGFGLKLGLVPFHVWMPLAYSAAPIPAAAVLSGAAVKAGVIGLIRFLPLDTSLQGWGTVLVAAGFFSAFYGVVVGITQSNPKTVLAYSSVSQMGLLATILGVGLVTGDNGVGLAASFYAAHHVLVKGGLFLAIGVVRATGKIKFWTVLLPSSVLALSLAGLPLTGGALAKLVVKAPLGSGVPGTLAMLSAAGSTLLVLHFLARLVAVGQVAPRSAPARLASSWLVTAVASVAIPWALYLIGMGSFSEALAPAALWAAVWPILLGAVLALALLRWGPLPRLPEGDIVVFASGAEPAARTCGEAFLRLDGILRQWPVASVLLLVLVLLLGATLLAGP
jgi:formate hydrogenlyase subunit 3/multisubunit Na+/H+ antiporter MnhD subunit